MLAARKVENGLVILECPDNSIGLVVQDDDDEIYTLREMAKEYIFHKTTRKRVPKTPQQFSITLSGVKSPDKCVNAKFGYDTFIYDNDKIALSDEEKQDPVLRLAFFEDISKKKTKNDPFINLQKYTKSDFEGFSSFLKEEKYPITLVLVDQNEISEIYDFLDTLIQNGNRVMILTYHGDKNAKANYKIIAKGLSLIIDRIQKDFTTEDFGKQTHLLAYKSTAFLAYTYLSYKGLDTNLTSTVIFNSNIDELDVLSSEEYLHMDLSNSKLDSKIERYRVKTPVLSLSLNKTYDEVKDKYHKNRNPWICKCTRFYDLSYFKDHKPNEWFTGDIIGWIEAWKDFDFQDSYDADLDDVNPNWMFIKQEGDDFSSDDEDDEREDFINDEFMDEAFFSINDPEQRILSREDLNEYQKTLEEKREKLQKIITLTLPDKIKMKFDNMDSYFQYLTYSLLLEELYSENICLESYIKPESSHRCSLFVNTKQTFDNYVAEEYHHLKKHAFSRDQPIYIFKRQDADLNWKKVPKFWIARVERADLCHFEDDGTVKVTSTKNRVNPDKTNQISMYSLVLYDWNSFPFPKNENPANFAFLPGNIVLGRVFSAMENISNPIFTNLILGQNKLSPKIPKVQLDKWFTKLNDSQKSAVCTALTNDVTLVQGPPGTGKTASIYEMVLQFLDAGIKPVMVVAASNLAVDNIAEKMITTHADKILRVTSNVRERDYSQEHLLGPICLHNKISKHFSPEIKEIEEKLREDLKNIDDAEFSKYHDEAQLIAEGICRNTEVIFTTTASIGNKHINKLDNIPVLIMDEATQSSEQLTLIAMAVRGCTKVILVGDPKQLSVFTEVKTLQMSLFERVLANGVYTKPMFLNTQYRMHPAISEFSRENIYNNELKDGISTEDRVIKKLKYPLFFFDHQGLHAIEEKTFSIHGEDFGFSWSNKVEAKYVVEMVEILIRDRKIAPSDIGVMTGYSAQRELLVKELKRNSVVNPEKCHVESYVDTDDISIKRSVTVVDINGLIVASVDAFQGREKKVMIMSLVRSNNDGTIGFMTDERRMNVALTRAQYSMILVGNAKCFSKNEFWKGYIDSLEKKGYVHTDMYNY
ncbi:hypothetical protein CANINC_003225 [Pichia inconspicua]|uniref:AAA+ ATPase domain-containing protein n=1 Tax=Pichia inconspicua TaxID=52247 RepID=A0A4T0X0T4_9ASCO|nr:hypothetical protein CANINC_003225 [[Candida] inconspicua]